MGEKLAKYQRQGKYLNANFRTRWEEGKPAWSHPDYKPKTIEEEYKNLEQTAKQWVKKDVIEKEKPQEEGNYVKVDKEEEEDDDSEKEVDIDSEEGDDGDYEEGEDDEKEKADEDYEEGEGDEKEKADDENGDDEEEEE